MSNSPRFLLISSLFLLTLTAYATAATCKTTAECDDQNKCTRDYCDAIHGCVHERVSCDRDRCVDIADLQGKRRPVELDVVWIVDASMLARKQLPADLPAVFSRWLNSLQTNHTPPVNTRAAIVSLSSTGSEVQLGFTSSTQELRAAMARLVAAGENRSLYKGTEKRYPTRLAGIADTMRRVLNETLNGFKLEVRPDAERHITLITTTSMWHLEAGGADSAAKPECEANTPDGGEGSCSGAASTGKRGKDEKLPIEEQIAGVGSAMAKKRVTMTLLLETYRLSDNQKEARRATKEKELLFKYLGHTERDNAYADYTGFSAAVSLKDYERHQRKDSKQPPIVHFLLQKGMHARAFELERVNLVGDGGKGGMLVDNGLYTVPHTNPKGYFCNRCYVEAGTCDPILGCAFAAVNCTEGKVCIPRQGCVVNGSKIGANDVNPDRNYMWMEKPLITHGVGEGYTTGLSYAQPPNTTSGNLRAVPWLPVPAGSKHGDATVRASDKKIDNRKRKSWTKEHLVKTSVEVKEWEPDKPFVQMLIDRDEPLILRNTVVDYWEARFTWNPQQLAAKIGVDEMFHVKHAKDFTLFDVDYKQPMNRLLGVRVAKGYTHINMTTKQFFEKVANPGNGEAYYYFGNLTIPLQRELIPDVFMFADDYDMERHEQYVWISSRGPRMHTHFDQDRNVFVQMHGEKIFTLFPPAAIEDLHIFPRIHPLWHKSQLHFDMPDLELFPNYRRVKALEAHLLPGDVLYIPPYWWHHVQSVSGSVSISQWSRLNVVMDAMNAIYGKGTPAEEVRTYQAKIWALRLYIDMLITEVVGFGQVYNWVRKLLDVRYRHVREFFPEQPDWTEVCSVIRLEDRIIKAAEFDVQVGQQAYVKLKPEIRDVLLADYIEEVACSVVGMERMYGFFRYCFFPEQTFAVDELADGGLKKAAPSDAEGFFST